MGRGLTFDYKIKRSDRRTLGIKVTRSGKVEVHAPVQVSADAIERFVSENSGWIEKNLGAIREQNEAAAAFSPGRDSGLLLLGREYPLHRREGKAAGFDGSSFYIPAYTPQGEVVRTIKEIYRSLAKSYLCARTTELARQFGESVGEIKINSARTRWGSCSSKGNINFSLFLIMAPPQAVDYCIIHELSHLRHMNHSESFRQLVKSRDADCEAHRAQLKELQRRLARESW